MERIEIGGAFGEAMNVILLFSVNINILKMLSNYFKIAWRNMMRNKPYTLINVLGLAVGVCACLVIFLVCRYEFSFDKFHPDKEEIYRVGLKNPNLTFYQDGIPAPMPVAFRQEISGLDAVTGFYPYWPKITIREKNQKPKDFSSDVEGTDDFPRTIITDTNYFSIFKYQWLVGNPLTSLTKPFQVVLSERQAHKYFGMVSFDKIIGREVIYNDTVSVAVSGIVKDWNENTDFPFTDFISFSTISNSSLKNHFSTVEWTSPRGKRNSIWTFVKISKSIRVVQINHQFQKLLKKYSSGDPYDAHQFLTLEPLSDIHFNNNYSHDNIRKADLKSLYVVMAIASFILLIAVINFINLSTALSMKRSKEIGVRKVLGSGRKSLIFQFLTETFVLTCIAVGLAVLMVKPVLFAFHGYIPPAMNFYFYDTSALLFILLIIAVTTLFAGFYPAKVLSSHQPVVSLKGGVASGTEKGLMRKGLIIFQFTVSLVFIVGTLTMGKQIRFMLNTDYGLDRDAILTLAPDWREKPQKLLLLSERVKKLPSVTKLIKEGGVPIGWGHMDGIMVYKGKEEIELNAEIDVGNQDFIPFYQMKLVEGRNLLQDDSLREFVINETFARALDFKKPAEALDKLIYWNSKSYVVVGIVADFHVTSFRETIKPLVIVHLPQMEDGLGVKLATKEDQAGNVSNTLTTIEKIWKEIYPKDPFNYVFMDESIARMYETEQNTSMLMKASMLLAIFISCIGIFGLSMFMAEKRKREIGIRKVLGASVANIVSMLNRDFVILVIISIFIATPIAWYFMNQWLRQFAYRIHVNGWIFALAGLSAILIATATVSFQGVKAAVANPVKSLRTE